MSAGWEAGDVARIQYMEESPMVAVWVEDCLTPRHEAAGHWHTQRGSHGRHPDHVARLVVIDPEDREQVERLLRAIATQHSQTESWDNRASDNKAKAITDSQAALRSLITPPKPDEPTGLGAVVEDDTGRRWYRTADVSSGTSDESPCAVWKRDNTNRLQETKAFSYGDIAAVKVLSEGVTR